MIFVQVNCWFVRKKDKFGVSYRAQSLTGRLYFQGKRALSLKIRGDSVIGTDIALD